MTVKPSSRIAAVTPLSDREYRVAVQAAARDGKANEAVVEILADYFSVPKSKVRILRGHTGRKKLVAID